MICKIKYTEALDKSIIYLLDKLPNEISSPLCTFLNQNCTYTVNEVRIKKNSFITLVSKDKCILTNVYVREETLQEIFICLCGGSIYAHSTTISNGYISLGKGLRAGICGKASIENGLISGICDISSISVRIPHTVSGASDFLYRLLENEGFESSVIIYSPPGVGKTTILRDLACKLSTHAIHIRHSIIDTREEITPFIEDKLTSDVFLGYPKGIGIEQATKSMTPRLIICDEISSADEADAILKAIHSGVKLIATTHAGSYEELLAKEITIKLLNAHAFDYALGIQRKFYSTKYKYTLNKL